MTTTRERKQNKVERLRGWADTRAARANAVFKQNERYTTDHAFNTQPGHIPFRAKIIRQEDNAFRSLDKARGMTARAAGIEDQLDKAIYSDDPDAAEALTARIAELEAKRDGMKARNAAYRAEHKTELKTLTAYGRDQVLPHASYTMTNLTANIARNKKRLAELASPRKFHGLIVRYGGPCDTCGKTLEKGDWAGYSREDKALRCAECYQKPGGSE